MESPIRFKHTLYDMYSSERPWRLRTWLCKRWHGFVKLFDCNRQSDQRRKIIIMQWLYKQTINIDDCSPIYPFICLHLYQSIRWYICSIDFAPNLVDTKTKRKNTRAANRTKSGKLYFSHESFIVKEIFASAIQPNQRQLPKSARYSPLKVSNVFCFIQVVLLDSCFRLSSRNEQTHRLPPNVC